MKEIIKNRSKLSNIRDVFIVLFFMVLLISHVSEKIDSATFGTQDVSMAGSIKIDNVTYSTNTWYKITNQLARRRWVTISNNGVNNDKSTTCMLYVSLLNSTTTEAGAVTLPRILPLTVGQSIQLTMGSDITINVQGNTLNMCIGVIELDEDIPKGPHDT